MSSYKSNNRFIQAAVKELETYLLSEVLFWPLSANPPRGEPAYTKLTIGGLLIAIEEVRCISLPSAEERMFNQSLEHLDLVRSQWLSAWRRKAKREYKSRINQWHKFLLELRRDRELQFVTYAYEVRVRVMLQLLCTQIEEFEPGNIEMLNALDKLLRSIFFPGEFVWREELKDGFKPDEFWFLWGNCSQ